MIRAQETMLRFRARPDYQRSRDIIIIGDDAHPFLGCVYAWPGESYWAVRDSNDKTVAYVRHELGGLYGPKAAEAESIQWAARVLQERVS